MVDGFYKLGYINIKKTDTDNQSKDNHHNTNEIKDIHCDIFESIDIDIDLEQNYDNLLNMINSFSGISSVELSNLNKLVNDASNNIIANVMM